MKVISQEKVRCDKQAYRQAIRTLKKTDSRRIGLKGKTQSAVILGRVLAAAGVLIAVTALVFAWAVQPSDAQLDDVFNKGVFAEGITVDGEDISLLPYDQAFKTLQAIENEKLQKTYISFELNGNTYSKTAAQFGITTDFEDVLKEAMLVDKTKAYLTNLKDKAEIKQSGLSYQTHYIADTDAVSKAITFIQDEFYTAPIEPVMVFDENAQSGEYIYWDEGKDGTALDVQDLLNRVTDSIPQGQFNLGVINDIVTAPQNTAETLSKNVVKIAEYSTSFYGVTLSEEKRVANIEKMAGLINGSVIEPGADWSFNHCSGERTKENGWQLANTLYGGVLVEEMGGGVCQVSSTVYNAFLLAELGILERHAHSRPSNYVPTGLDATVDYGVKDLNVVNTLEDTIYLVVKVDKAQKTITAMIYGPKPSHDYQVIVRALIWQSDIAPEEEAETVVATDGYAPDGTYVAPGTRYAYPKTTYGSRYKIYRYYYPKDYDDETDNPYSWVGYEKGDNASGEKRAVQYYTEDGSGKDIVTYYPPLAGTYYINPEDG